uniref:Lipoyl-binding domain-containing protein n=1 Tax=mine drainage metagenome TaxID=410659 RepID=E6Q7U7_9ZZZZ
MTPENPSEDEPSARAQRLAEFFVNTPLLRMRIERDDEEFEFARSSFAPGHRASEASVTPEPLVERPVDVLRADVVGILRFGRHEPTLGEEVAEERELAAIEALGIRTSVRARSSGRLTAILCQDGAAVDYGRALFEIERG